MLGRQKRMQRGRGRSWGLGDLVTTSKVNHCGKEYLVSYSLLTKLWVVCSAEKFQLLISFKDRVARGIKQNFFVEFLYDQA